MTPRCGRRDAGPVGIPCVRCRGYFHVPGAVLLAPPSDPRTRQVSLAWAPEAVVVKYHLCPPCFRATRQWLARTVPPRGER